MFFAWTHLSQAFFCLFYSSNVLAITHAVIDTIFCKYVWLLHNMHFIFYLLKGKKKRINSEFVIPLDSAILYLNVLHDQLVVCISYRFSSKIKSVFLISLSLVEQ